MLLQDRTAIVYGAGGFVGGAVARAFACEGARVHLVGRSAAKLEDAVTGVRTVGGSAEAAVLDVLDEIAVEHHAEAVAAEAGGIDIAFNAMAYGDIQGAPLVELPLEYILDPVTTALRGQLLTARAVARHMVQRRSGVLMTVTGHGSPFPGMGGTPLAWNVVEGLYRQLACELGPHGVRVVWLRTGGFAESILGAAAYDATFSYVDGALVPVAEAAADDADETLRWLEGETMLQRLPSLADAGSAAVFLASDHARSVTATAINLTSGAVAD